MKSLTFRRLSLMIILTAMIFVGVKIVISDRYVLSNLFMISETVVGINSNCPVQRSDFFHANVFNGIKQQYDLRIIVITYDRPGSLQRLLNSLNKVDYQADRIKLEIWIDRSKTNLVDMRTVKVSSGFHFLHGECDSIVHSNHTGLIGQWLTTWRAIPDSQEIAVFLEDDLTLSPHFYKYLKLVHEKYDGYRDINGYTLQGVSITHGSGGILQGPKNSHVFLYPVIGTWGFSPSVRHWIEFTNWFSKVNSNNSFHPYIPGNIITDWYKTFQKQGRADSMWSIWHAYHSWRKKYYTLYANFGNQKGLTTNWREPGLHYKGESSRTNDLLATWDEKYETLPVRPIRIDISGKEEKN